MKPQLRSAARLGVVTTACAVVVILLAAMTARVWRWGLPLGVAAYAACALGIAFASSRILAASLQVRHLEQALGCAATGAVWNQAAVFAVVSPFMRFTVRGRRTTSERRLVIPLMVSGRASGWRTALDIAGSAPWPVGFAEARYRETTRAFMAAFRIGGVSLLVAVGLIGLLATQIGNASWLWLQLAAVGMFVVWIAAMAHVAESGDAQQLLAAAREVE